MRASTWVGPPPAAIRAMGDKAAREAHRARGRRADRSGAEPDDQSDAR